MTVGMVKRGRIDGDPIGAEAPRGKSRYQRKSGRDPGLTPTEVHQKNLLMRQFMKNPEGTINSEAYKTSAVWCRGCDGRRLAVLDGLCSSCSYEKNIAKPLRKKLDELAAQSFHETMSR